MDYREFMERLIDSYPPGLRPDEGFLAELQIKLSTKALQSCVWSETLTLLSDSFRMFPSLADINSTLIQIAAKYAKPDSQWVWEHMVFDNGTTAARKVEITEDGEILRTALPVGAIDGILSLPPHLQDHHNCIDYRQAVAEGVIDERAALMLVGTQTKHPIQGRFEKIGSLLKEEPRQFSEYDDSPEALGAFSQTNWSDDL